MTIDTLHTHLDDLVSSLESDDIVVLTCAMEHLGSVMDTTVSLLNSVKDNPNALPLIKLGMEHHTRVMYEFGIRVETYSPESIDVDDLSSSQEKVEASLEGILDTIKDSVKGMLNNRRRKKLDSVNKKKYDKTIDILNGFIKDLEKTASSIKTDEKVEIELPGPRDTFAADGVIAKDPIKLIETDAENMDNFLRVFSQHSHHYISTAMSAINAGGKGSSSWEVLFRKVFDLDSPIEGLPSAFFEPGELLQNSRIMTIGELVDIDKSWNNATKHYAIVSNQPALHFTKCTKEVTGEVKVSLGLADLKKLIEALKTYSKVLVDAKKEIFKFSDVVLSFAVLFNKVPTSSEDGFFIVMAANSCARALDSSQDTVLTHLGRSAKAVSMLAEQLAKKLSK
jgi:hypothetical protein